MADLVLMETWRGEAWCPTHLHQEGIARVRSSVPLRATPDSVTFTAVVVFECGEHNTIVTTAKNLRQMKGS